jgi:catechol 2,3-dioxygenase-like lactoylglutathione lyase family enzyme
MLGNRPAHAMMPASNLQRAKKFYSERLGLELEREAEEGIIFKCGNTWVDVFPSSGKSNAAFTQVGWDVDNLEDEIKALKARGVVFEEYNTPNLKTVNGIATMGSAKGAWFKDSEGNLLALVQRVH